MASYSGGSYASSQETTNFACMCRIVVDVLRDILWQVLIHEIPPADLPTRVQMNQHKLRNLDAKINTYLCGISPSSPEIPIAKKFNVSSLYTLIRNVCSQVPAPSTQWGKPPPPGGTTLGDDIERVREFRNSLYGHATQAKIDSAYFNKLCIAIRNVVSRFDVYFSSKFMKCDFKREIDVILSGSMDKSLQDTYIDKMKKIAVLSNGLENVKQQVDNMEHEVGDVGQKVHDVECTIGDIEQKVANAKQKVGSVGQKDRDIEWNVWDVKQQSANLEQKVGEVEQKIVDVERQVRGLEQHIKEQVYDVKAHLKKDSVLPAEIIHMDEKSILLFREAQMHGQVQINNLRIMVVGHSGVGKTTLTKRLLGKEVCISKEKSTEGIDIHRHCCKVSLDKGEWIVQHEDLEQYSRLQYLVKLFNEAVQKHKESVEQEIQRRKAGLSAGIDQTGHRVDTVIKKRIPQQKETSVNKSNVLPTSHETGSFIVEVDNKHAGQKTNTSTISLGEAMSSKSEISDVVVEIHDLIKLINKNTNKLEKSTVEYAALTIWDFAGQYVFYTTHQTFLTSRALYLLVIDLSQQVTYPIEGDMVFLDTEGIKPCKVHDMIEIWLNSIHFCSPESGIPPVILVGTHMDKIPEKSRQEVINQYFKSVYCMLGKKPIIFHLKGDIAIDNNLCDSNPGLEELKKMIFELAKKQPHWGEKRPARWIPMEQAIMALKHSGSKVFARSHLVNINRRDSVGIDDKDELDLFLKFHHEIGTILYFSVDELKENIILEPKWMIDALKSLITADTLIRKNPAIASKWKEFNEKGKLTQELLDAVWSEENNPEFHQHKDFIVKLMEKLNILAKPLSQKDGKGAQVENYFLAPCMLKEATPVEFISPYPKESVENTSVLCYVFRENFLPPPIFHRLIAACVAQWPVAWNGSEYLIYCGCCIYQLDSHHRLTLFFREHVIFVRVTRMGTVEKNQSYKLCIEAKEFITLNLSNVIKHLGQNVQFQLCIRCPELDGYSVESLVRVGDLQRNVDFPCHSHGKGGHLISSYQVLKFWFQEVRQTVVRSKEGENQPKGSNQESPIPRKQSRKDTAQQKRRLHFDKNRPASKKRIQGTLKRTNTDSVSAEKYIEVQQKHNRLCVYLNDVTTKDSFRNIKRTAKTYVGSNLLENVEDMENLFLKTDGQLLLESMIN